MMVVMTVTVMAITMPMVRFVAVMEKILTVQCCFVTHNKFCL